MNSELDRNMPIQSLRTAEDWLGATLDNRRFSTLLLGLFGALAMILASVGIYGVLNYWVSTRQGEMAIGLAVGEPSDGAAGVRSYLLVRVGGRTQSLHADRSPNLAC